jgi:hypothetical protein
MLLRHQSLLSLLAILGPGPGRRTYGKKWLPPALSIPSRTGRTPRSEHPANEMERVRWTFGFALAPGPRITVSNTPAGKVSFSCLK